ncbi:MAG TPA: response regulator [Polyangiaceae bacterium]|nr:response regulator [Polyangiaceae bacterium]
MPRVLICDDDPDIAEVMGEFFQDHGIDCVTTHSFDEVVAHRTESLGCSLAILDVNLGFGQPSGVDVFRWLQREHFAGSVVFLTGHAVTSSLLDGARTLGVPILSKPIEGETLLRLADAEASA